jgi:membrane-bound lytic murein transglycosylase D
MFGDWTLALAAYNWGEGNLARSIARTRARGEAESYENVAMPNETRNYVPKLIAIRNILAEPSKYGIKLDRFPNKPYFATVSTGKHIDLDLAAKLADTPLRELKELNPAYNLPVAAYKSGRQLLVPVDKLSRFEHNLARWDKPLLNWQVVMPGSGESIQSIASRFGMNASELISANRLSSPRLQPGHPLLVALRKGSEPAGGISINPIGDTDTPTLVASAGPTETAVLTTTAETAASKPAPTPLTLVASAVPTAAPPVAVKAVLVESKTLEASKAPVENKIEVSNAGKTESVAASSSAAMAVAVTASEPAPIVAKVSVPVNPNATTHTVGSGDTLYNISHRYSLTVAELKTLNSLPDDTVKLGQVLKLKPESNNGAAVTAVATSAQDDAVVQVSSLKPAAPAAAPRAVPVEYVVQKGDTLFSIARKFGVRHTDIRDEAALRRHGLVPGQRVWIQGL